MRTFTNSTETIDYLQKRFGSANFSRWQTLRKQFYSYVQYPAAGINQITFFGSAVGNSGTNRQTTNMPKAGSFGQNHFLLKSIRCKLFIADRKLTSWAGTDASTLYSDLVDGFLQAGYFELTIGNRSQIQLPRPFQYAPPADGRPQLLSEGFRTFTLSTGTAAIVATADTAIPYAELASRKVNSYLVDPNILIEAEQNFEVTLTYPSGLIPVIATDVVNDSTNPLYVGVSVDGLIFRPQQ